jgi:hypothetical protein
MCAPAPAQDRHAGLPLRNIWPYRGKSVLGRSGFSCYNRAMKKSYFISFMLGFLFGTGEMFLLAMLSLMFAAAERIANVFFIPGRYMAAQFVGPQGSNTEVFLLTLFNGILYGLIFAIGYEVFQLAVKKLRVPNKMN